MILSTTPGPRPAGPSSAGPRPAGPASAAATGNREKPPASGPRTDCTADSAGGVTFDVVLSGPAARGEGALVLRLRGGDPRADSVRLPLMPLGEGRLRAVLPGTVELTEGRWNAYVTFGDSRLLRLTPGLNDLRALVDRTPGAGSDWLGVRIPYTTTYGNLSLRVWLRRPHAEAGDILIDGADAVLHGRLYGAGLTPTARLEAHPRHTSAPPVSAPATPLQQHGQAADRRDGRPDGPDGQEGADGQEGREGHEGRERQDGPDGRKREHGRQGKPGEQGQQGQPFSAPLPYEELIAYRGSGTANEVWDLWLRPSESAAPVRIARILDDILDKRNIFRYPQQELPGAAVTLAYTGDNNLAVRVKWTDQGVQEGDRAGQG